jgi:hypothetical protein
MEVREIGGSMRIPMNLAFAALLVVLSFLPLLAVAQDETAPQELKSKERISREGEVQTGQKKVRAASTATMKPERKPVATPVNGKTLRMEDALKAKQPTPQGRLQPKLDMAQSEKPRMGKGAQKPGSTMVEKAAGSHLQLLVKVSPNGTAEVVSAKEVAGAAPDIPPAFGQWLYAVKNDSKTVAVQGIPDPFEMRSFAPPPGSPLEGQGHHFEQAQTAFIPVTIPNLSLKSPGVAKLSLQLYQLKDGPRLVDPKVFEQLQQEKKLEMKIHVPAATLSRQIQLRALKVPQPQ